MPTVIIRTKVEVTDAGAIATDDIPSTHNELERMTGKKLDRRKSYALVKGVLCEAAKWSQCCSGCGPEWKIGSEAKGMGCDECGYTGRSVQSYWLPIA